MTVSANANAAISFNIPLKAPLAQVNGQERALIVASTGNGSGHGCPGTVEAPTAEPGFLCAYRSSAGAQANYEGAGVILDPGIQYSPEVLGTAGQTGAILIAVPVNEAEPTSGYGTWASPPPQNSQMPTHSPGGLAASPGVSGPPIPPH